MSKLWEPVKNPSVWRRIAIGGWKRPNNPTLFALLSVDLTKGLAFLEEINKKSDVTVTINHLAAKAAALTLKKFPHLNAIVRRRKTYFRKSVDLFIQVSIEAESTSTQPDLSGAKIDHCDQKDILQIARELKQKCDLIRREEDPQFKKSYRLFRILPPFLVRWALIVMDFFAHGLGLPLPFVGLPPNPFGSAMVTGLTTLRGPSFFSALPPFSRVSLMVCVGGLEIRPSFENGKLIGRPTLSVTTTSDHRIIDGLEGARALQYLQNVLEDPAKFFLNGKS